MGSNSMRRRVVASDSSVVRGRSGKELFRYEFQLKKIMKRESISVLFGIALVVVSGSPLRGVEPVELSADRIEDFSEVKLEATQQFWAAFQREATEGNGLEVFSCEAWTENIKSDQVIQIVSDIAKTELKRSMAISSLPVMNVDPDAVAFAAEFAVVKSEICGAIGEGLSIWGRQEQIIHPVNLGAGFLVNMAAQSDKGNDGAWLLAALGQAAQTVGELKALRKPVEGLENRVFSTLSRLIQLQAEQMKLRGTLSQRYGVEFATVGSMVRNDPQEIPEFSEQQIMNSLIGSNVYRGLDGWEFRSMKEFASLEILESKPRGNIMHDYVVLVHVKRPGFFGIDRKMKLRVTYAVQYTRLRLARLAFEA